MTLLLVGGVCAIASLAFGLLAQRLSLRQRPLSAGAAVFGLIVGMVVQAFLLVRFGVQRFPEEGISFSMAQLSLPNLALSLALIVGVALLVHLGFERLPEVRKRVLIQATLVAFLASLATIKAHPWTITLY